MTNGRLNLLEASMRNFLSYGNATTVVDLTVPGTTLIIGEDLDSGTGSANGVGKAQPLDSKIKIPGGWTVMGDLSVGDQVTSIDGTPMTVTGIYPQGSKPIFRLTFQDGRTAEACEDHLWEVSSFRWMKDGTHPSSRIVSTKEIVQILEKDDGKKSAWYNLYVPLNSHEDQLDVDLPIDPYLLGALLGDGCLTMSSPRFSDVDQTVIESLQLRGCNKFIPEIYKHASLKQKQELLQGLFDTDGTVGKTGNLSFATSSKQLSEDVAYLIRSIGGTAKITTRVPTYTYNGQQLAGALSYNVCIRYHSRDKLVSVPHKLARLSTNYQYSNLQLKIVKAEYVGQKEAQCIMVDHPRHLYITNDFVVTHNTVILNTIVYGLFGIPLKKDMKLDSLINNVNKKNMEVKLKFEIGGHVYEVHRFRKCKQGTGVALYSDGELITPDSVDATNDKIVEIIGYSYEIFVRIVVYSANHQPFFELPTSGAKKPTQRDIIEELFGLTALTDMAKELKDEIKEYEQRAGIIHAKIEQIDKEKARHEKQIESTRQRISDWEDDRAAKISKLKNQLKSIEGIDFDKELELYKTQDKLQTLRKDTKSQVSGFTSKQSDLASQKKKLEKEIKSLHDATCPYCNQKFEGAEEKLHENELILIEMSAEMQTVEDSILKFGDELDQIVGKLETIDDQITTDNLNVLLKIRDDREHIVEKIEDLSTQINPYLSTLDELLNMDLDEAEYTSINELEDTINHQKFLHKLLTKEDSFVRKRLIDQNIPALNMKLKQYIGDMGLPHKVEFTNTMEPSISMMGRPLEFANLSTGQQARVNFSLSLAFRAVLQKMFSPVNFSMVDEVLDIGLCPVGVKAAAKLLRKIASEEGVTMFIISHRDELESVFDRTMKVQMKKGFSHIVME